MINAKNVHLHELIGLHVKVADAKNKANIGVCGKIIDETQKSLVVRENNATKRVMKNGAVFEVTINSKKVPVEGEKIAFRPWERLSK